MWQEDLLLKDFHSALGGNKVLVVHRFDGQVSPQG